MRLQRQQCHVGRRSADACSRAACLAAPRAQQAAAARRPRPFAAAAHSGNGDGTAYDAIIIGSGMGGLTSAAQMVSKGARVLVLEKYTIPGGSAGHFKREGYTFDVGSSMMFGFGNEGTTNLITQCLQAVGKRLDTLEDPFQVHYHLPKSAQFPEGLDVRVPRLYQTFLSKLCGRFPHERQGIHAFYNECWRVFHALNSIELRSLEEPRYLMQQFIKSPLSCLKLASCLTSNTGEIARRYIKDPELLRFIDMECFTYSTVSAELTPMVTSGMVLSDRHYGGVNYPIGGIGRIAETLAEGIIEHGGEVRYKANVKKIILEKDANGKERATGVQLADGTVYRAKTVVSNATRWDTFEKMIEGDHLPVGEQLFRKRYKKAPSFFSMHLGVKAEVIPVDTECHHIILQDWNKMETAHGTLFVSMPSILDSSLAPAGRHIVHAFTPDWIDNWQGLSHQEYERKKEAMADELCQRLESLFPGLRDAITLKEIGTPRTHQRFLNRIDGTYGPIPSKAPWGIVTMPLNTTDIEGLYCVGDSTFPGQGVNAVVFSGFGCSHRVMCDLGMMPTWPQPLDQGWRAFLKWGRETALASGLQQADRLEEQQQQQNVSAANGSYANGAYGNGNGSSLAAEEELVHSNILPAGKALGGASGVTALATADSSASGKSAAGGSQ